jgi:hypothetical protein
VNHTRCEFEGCDKIQIFGSPADRMVRSCKAHKLEGYVDVVNKMCGEADGCETQANYGSDAEDVVRFCKPHSNDGAVYLSKLRCARGGPRPTAWRRTAWSTGGRRSGAGRCCVSWRGRAARQADAAAGGTLRRARRQLGGSPAAHASPQG